MKKEILSIRNFNLRYSNAVTLKNISLSLMEGESSALMGLASSGKDAFFQVATGNEWSGNGSVHVDNVKIKAASELGRCIHLITDLNYSISDWTVAEYIGLVSNSFFPLFHKKKILTDEIQDLFFELDLDIDVNRKISELTEIEKRIIDLVKAYRKKTKILAIEDEFNGISTNEIIFFKKIMDRIISGRMTVLVKIHSVGVSSILADNFIIFKNGYIIKKCRKEFIESEKPLEKYILGEYGISDNRFEEKNITSDFSQKTVYRVKNIIIDNCDNYSFSFNSGEVVSILALDINKKEKIFNILSGRETDRSVKFYIDQERFFFSTISDFVARKVVSSINLGTQNEFLDKMTVGENIIIPSLKKFSSLRYIFYGKKMIEVLEKQLYESSGFSNLIDDDETNSRILIMLERWYVFRPRVFVLLEPFLHCDVYGTSIIKTYIRKFTDTGTAVIIVKAREKDIVNISDRIIKI